MNRNRSMRQQGYSLIEVMIATGILSIVAALSFVVLKSSNEAVTLATNKAEIQASLRTVMGEITRELEAAYMPVHVAMPSARLATDDFEVSSDHDSVSFMMGARAENGIRAVEAGPVTLTFVNEDVNRNQKLDSGEDTNGDGALTRCIQRRLGDDLRVLGSANDFESVFFELLPSMSETDPRQTRVRVQLVASRRHGLNEEHVVRAELESIVQLTNY